MIYLEIYAQLVSNRQQIDINLVQSLTQPRGLAPTTNVLNTGCLLLADKQPLRSKHILKYKFKVQLIPNQYKICN